jgi:hypothetical protein
MTQDDFEAAVLELWTKTRVPLTRANVLSYTKVPRTKAERWLDEMVKARVLDLESDADGELLWEVRGSRRPSGGAETIGELERKERLSSEVDRLTSGASLALRAAGLSKPTQGGQKKSMLASGALSFFFGPIGWIYAAPLKEALPAIIAYVIVCSVLPNFLLVYVLGLVNGFSALAGALYAWSYNHGGERAPLFGKAAKAWSRTRKR